MSKAQAEVIAELRLEIERLKKGIAALGLMNEMALKREESERRSIAERQREACAKRCDHIAMQESRYASNVADDCATEVRATPLVTEET